MLRMNLARGRRHARRAAGVLDELVDKQVSLLPQLPEHRRAAAADYLAELALLAAAYRYYADRWIGREELERRGHVAIARLDELRAAQQHQREFTDLD
ncbi:MAG: hypothetical protein GEU98_23285 [Pseudonocardiaceae bacterium]|nr:hypothetical protein [Pseudonocardiaceae bacterium]